jgi:hypothetical protein
MTETVEPAGKVLVNRDLFAIKLGIPQSKSADFFKVVAVFTGGATATTLATYLSGLASLGPVGQVLVYLGVVSAPAVLWPAVVGGAVLAGGVYGTSRILRMYSSATTLEGKRSFSSPLSDLAIAVADVVFLPLTILIRADEKSHPDEKQQVRAFMLDWGYGEVFIEDYLQSSLDEEVNASVDRFNQLLQELRRGKNKKFLRDVCIGRMKKQVLEMGRRVMEADGAIDFREQILLDYYAKKY